MYLTPVKNIIFSVILALLSFQLTVAQKTFQISKNTKTILFVGDSITYQAFYVNYFITYIKLNNPDIDYDFLNIGLPSETVSKLSEPGHAKGKFPRPKLQERLKRTLETLKPDLVFACYGINDGIYLPFDNSRFKKFQKGIEYLHRKVLESGAEIVHLNTTIYDALKGDAYTNVMDIYGDWILSKKFTDNWDIVDIHTPLTNALAKERSSDNSFMLTRDGIHPKPVGHWIMTKALIQFLNPKNYPDTKDADTYFSKFENGLEIFKLIQKQQKILTDAWLTEIGHKRPNMKKGLPINEALIQSKKIDTKIDQLLAK